MDQRHEHQESTSLRSWPPLGSIGSMLRLEGGLVGLLKAWQRSALNLH